MKYKYFKYGNCKKKKQWYKIIFSLGYKLIIYDSVHSVYSASVIIPS